MLLSFKTLLCVGSGCFIGGVLRYLTSYFICTRWGITQTDMPWHTLVINFDCVSDGNNILFVAKKGASDLASKLEDAFISNDKYSVEVVTKGAFYPSDQKNFTKGVGVAALNKLKCGILYMDKIHTPKDTVYDEENIEFLKCGAIKLVGLFTKD